jgi:hypothetical protein
MKQINIRVTDEEYKILQLIAQRKNIPVSSVFRLGIHDAFDQWKIEELFKLYSEGQIRFKEIVNLSNWTYAALIKKYAELGYEPPIFNESEMMADEITQKFINNAVSILKKPK